MSSHIDVWPSSINAKTLGSTQKKRGPETGPGFVLPCVAGSWAALRRRLTPRPARPNSLSLTHNPKQLLDLCQTAIRLQIDESDATTLRPKRLATLGRDVSQIFNGTLALRQTRLALSAGQCSIGSIKDDNVIFACRRKQGLPSRH